MLTSLWVPGWTREKFLTAKDTRKVGPTVDWLLRAPFDPGESMVIPHPRQVLVTGPALAWGVSTGTARRNVASRIDAPIHCFFQFILFIGLLLFQRSLSLFKEWIPNFPVGSKLSFSGLSLMSNEQALRL